MKLHGIFPPLTTPFDHNGDIWKIKVEHNVARLNLTGVAGYAVIGSTGESKLLTTDEKVKLWEWVAQYAAPEKILIAGTGVESVRETVALTNRAAEIGYKVALVATPHYYKNLIASPDAQKLYYRAVADQTNIPVLIYNWPQMTGIDVPAEAVAELSQHPNIAGIKESSGNLAKVVQMLNEVKEIDERNCVAYGQNRRTRRRQHIERLEFGSVGVIAAGHAQIAKNELGAER